MKSCFAALSAALIVLAGCGGPSATPAPPRPASPSAAPAGTPHPPGWGLPPAPALVQLGAPRGPVATMYDTTEVPGAVPANPFAVAGYTAGRWPTYLPLRARFPKAHVVSIAIAARYHADCLDIEPFDAFPWQAPEWVRADIAAGFPKPCLYSSYWEFVNEVRPALARAGISRSSVWEWDADYTFTPHIDAGFDATQWTDRAFGANLDASMVLRRFLSIAQPPYVEPPPGPSPRERALERRMAEVRVWLVRYGCRRRVEQHEHLGPRCRAKFAEGLRLHRELGR